MAIEAAFAVYDALGAWPFALLFGTVLMLTNHHILQAAGALCALAFLGVMAWSLNAPSAIQLHQAAGQERNRLRTIADEKRKLAEAEAAYVAQFGPRDPKAIQYLGVLEWKQSSPGTTEVVFDGDGGRDRTFDDLGIRIGLIGAWIAQKPDDRLPANYLIVVDRSTMVDRYGNKMIVDGVVLALKSDELRKVQWASLPRGGALALAELRSVHPAHAPELVRWCRNRSDRRGPAFAACTRTSPGQA